MIIRKEEKNYDKKITYRRKNTISKIQISSRNDLDLKSVDLTE